MALALIIGGIASGMAMWGWIAVGLGVFCAMSLGWGAVVRSWSASLVLSMFALSAAMIVCGALSIADGALWGPVFIAAGILGLMGLGMLAVAWPGLVAASSGAVAAVREPSVGGLMGSDRAEIQRLAHAVHELHDVALLSERARQAIWGDRDFEYLRLTLEARLHAGDFDGASRLCESIEARFGDTEAIAPLKAMIDEALDLTRRNELQQSLAQFDAALARQDWAAARAEAGQMQALWPNLPAVANLNERIDAARAQHKQALEAMLMEASRRDDVDAAMRILKELDRYMTRDEAARLGEEARSIIERHRERMSTAFRTALREKRWIDAAQHGNQIVAEFPNSKMANEVRSMLTVLHTRATQDAIAASYEG